MNIKNLSLSKLVVLAVKRGQISRYVYKYRSINENTENIFLKTQLWFSKPSDFNDPFDCQIVVQANNSEDEIANFLQQNAPTMSNKDIKIYSRYWSGNLSEWSDMVNKTIKAQINKSGICCFAGSGDNILMWSHYGDSHKGICIKFDLLADPNFFAVPLNVKYDTNYPAYNHFKDNSKLVESLIKTKSECWKYEEELRVLKQEFGKVYFKKEAIVEVIFGCGCNADTINKIKTLISENNFPDIKLKTTITSKSSYKLNIIDLK